MVLSAEGITMVNKGTVLKISTKGGLSLTDSNDNGLSLTTSGLSVGGIQLAQGKLTMGGVTIADGEINISKTSSSSSSSNNNEASTIEETDDNINEISTISKLTIDGYEFTGAKLQGQTTMLSSPSASCLIEI
jgi:hypothetical protein